MAPNSQEVIRRVAVVTGASRGIGRGIATALGERGWVVYVTGRSTGDGELTIDATARRVDEPGGLGVPVATDHGDDTQIAALFERVAGERGRLDLLVNNVYTIPDPPAWAVASGSTRSPSGTTRSASASAPTTSRAGMPPRFCSPPRPWSDRQCVFARRGELPLQCAYGAGKAGLDRLTADMAIELRGTGVATVTLYPGLVATEFASSWAERRGLDLAGAQTPLLVGRTVAALVDVSDLADALRVDPAGRRPRRGVRCRGRERTPTSVCLRPHPSPDASEPDRRRSMASDEPGWAVRDLNP